jgi:hypothetical protein
MLPLYEAVANSIHSIEDARISADQGRITVHIVRDGQGSLAVDQATKRPGPEAKGDIIGFKISDNGVGFSDVNFQSFQTLDSEYKASRGGRGVGRLLWLKAFERAIVESVYDVEEAGRRRRKFTFDSMHGVSDPTESDAGTSPRQTTIHLAGFAKRYREATPKTAQIIAKNLFEHCLWYFVRSGGAPTIEVVDGDEVVSLDDVYEAQMVAGATPESLEIKGVNFDLIHIKLSASSTRGHSIAFCAANRLVLQEGLRGKIPGLFGSLHDEAGDFVYECYVSSALLDERVRSERTSFDIEEEPLELFATTDMSQKEIRDAVIARAAAFLATYLEEKKRLGNERVSEFVATKAPRYRPILNRIPTDQLAVDPDMSDKDLELVLHKHLAEIERGLLADGHDVMKLAENESYEDYRLRLQKYLKTAEDIKKSDLASYVSHRRVILDLLEKAIQRRLDGKYEREDLIHNLIMPMSHTSDDLHVDTCNLWLIDERLAFHDFLASDKTLAAMPITCSQSTREPDLLALNVFDSPILVADSQSLPLASITVVELKRPMRNDAASGEDKDPVEQALGYLQRIREGRVTTQSGRPIPQCESIPGFCYAICDLTTSVAHRCKLLGLTPTHDFTGYFGYNHNFRAYIEVISFTGLVNAAKERNKAFFDRLGLPTR